MMVKILILNEKLKMRVQNVLVSNTKSYPKTLHDSYVTGNWRGGASALMLESLFSDSNPSILLETRFAFSSTGFRASAFFF